MVGQHPVGEDALVYLAHLPRTGDNAAAVDDSTKTVSIAVLADQQLRSELARAVQRPGTVQREVLSDSRRRGAPVGLIARELEPGGGLLQRQRVQRGHRIDPARREEQEVGAVSP